MEILVSGDDDMRKEQKCLIADKAGLLGNFFYQEKGQNYIKQISIEDMS